MAERISDQLRRLKAAYDQALKGRPVKGSPLAAVYVFQDEVLEHRRHLSELLVNQADNIAALIDAMERIASYNGDNAPAKGLARIAKGSLAAFGAGQDTNG